MRVRMADLAEERGRRKKQREFLAKVERWPRQCGQNQRDQGQMPNGKHSGKAIRPGFVAFRIIGGRGQDLIQKRRDEGEPEQRGQAERQSEEGP